MKVYAIFILAIPQNILIKNFSYVAIRLVLKMSNIYQDTNQYNQHKLSRFFPIPPDGISNITVNAFSKKFTYYIQGPKINGSRTKNTVVTYSQNKNIYIKNRSILASLLNYIYIKVSLVSIAPFILM